MSPIDQLEDLIAGRCDDHLVMVSVRLAHEVVAAVRGLEADLEFARALLPDEATDL